MSLLFLSKRWQSFWRMRAGVVAFAAVVMLAGCRSQDYSTANPKASAADTSLDAKIIHASELKRPVLVLVTESGQSEADDHVHALFEGSAMKKWNDRIMRVLIDISVSRNRATAARFHITNTPVLFCLSAKGLIISRDEAPITQALLLQRTKEVAQKSPELDEMFAALEQVVSESPNDAPARLKLANFLLAQKNDHEAIPHLEIVAHNGPADADLRVLAWAALARAHLWIGEPEKGRHEAQDLIAVLGPRLPDALAGGDLVLGLQDAANVKRIPLARHEFEEAIAAAPASTYGKQAAEELAKLPGAAK